VRLLVLLRIKKKTILILNLNKHSFIRLFLWLKIIRERLHTTKPYLQRTQNKDVKLRQRDMNLETVWSYLIQPEHITLLHCV